MQPGRTSAVGRIGNTPVVVLPGAPDQAFAAWWTLALPVLDRLSGRRPRKTLNLPLARKIASGVGIAEVVLLERKGGAWMTLAVGELSLDAIARAEAWLAGARRLGRVCCGHAGRCLYVAGMTGIRNDPYARRRKIATPSIRTSS